MIAALLLAMQATPESVAERDAAELAEMLVGTWNNAEAAYFAEELDGYPVHSDGFRIASNEGQLIVTDALGAQVRKAWSVKAWNDGTIVLIEPDAKPACVVRLERQGQTFLIGAPQDDRDEDSACQFLNARGTVATADALSLHYGEGGPVTFHRADPYTCWVSRKKDDAAGEGGWTWTPGVTVREGEYVQLPDDPAVARPAGIKLRHVRWPYGQNRDSLVLYVHEAEDEPAVSYAWTEPDAERIAINLRWVQASCTRSTE